MLVERANVALRAFVIGYKDGNEDIDTISKENAFTPFTACERYAHQALDFNHAVNFLETLTISEVCKYLECDIHSLDDAFKAYSLGFEKCMMDFLDAGGIQ